ncbi:hypothetical protein HDU76_012289, partial [Blyttiomyces sp. JEL0837]
MHKIHKAKSFAEQMPNLSSHSPKFQAAVTSLLTASPQVAANLYYGIGDCKNAPIQYHDNYHMVNATAYNNMVLSFVSGTAAPVTFTTTGVQVVPNIPSGFYSHSTQITYQRYDENATWTSGTSSFASHKANLVPSATTLLPQAGSTYFTKMPALTVDFTKTPITSTDDAGFSAFLDSVLTSTVSPTVTVAGTADLGVTFYDTTTNPNPVTLCIYQAPFSTAFTIQ